MTFKAGWLHYWRSYKNPWRFVLGFAVAQLVSRALYEVVKVVATHAAN